MAMRFIIATPSTGYCPAPDSAESLAASGASKIAVATSDTSARVGTGLVIIDSSICVATTTGLPARRGARELLLHARHLLKRHFHAEVAARDHDGVSEIENVADAADRLRLFDLRHDGGAAARDLLRVGDILGALDEREPDPVDAGVERGFEIGMILRGQRRGRDGGVGQAHALAARQLAADYDLGQHARGTDFERREADLP